MIKADVVSVWQVLPGTPSAPPIPAQRVARFDDHCTRNCLLQNKLRQRYSRYMSKSVIRLACYLAVVCGVSLRHIALLFSALFLIPITKSSIKRWIDDIRSHF